MEEVAAFITAPQMERVDRDDEELRRMQFWCFAFALGR